MKPDRLNALLRQFTEKRVLVIGDLMLDEFIWGRVSRISPEAPVPVVEVVRESSYPGGAANVARNVREFTDHVELCGLIGVDPYAERLREILRQCRIGLQPLQSEPTHQTIVKTRIVARQQQVVRVDRENPQAPSPGVLERTLAAVAALLPEMDAVVFEDYGKGFLSQEMIDQIAPLAAARKVVVTADPNPRNRLRWRGMTAIKPNRAEAFAAAGEIYHEPDRNPAEDEALNRVGTSLVAEWGPKLLLVTLGEQGMMLFQPDRPPLHIPPQAREVYDLSGAGDTAIALLTLALACGASPQEAAQISNHASGVVVGKLGTATLTPEELRESFRGEDPYA
jgi:rfaE bifunctional protein kinase chain/domain